MNTFPTILGALFFFGLVFGPTLLAIFRDPFYGPCPGPARSWLAALKKHAGALHPLS